MLVLDRVDSALLGELERDGRASFEALAQAVGLSRAATRARVQRLLDSHAVRIVGCVHPVACGLRAFAHVCLHVTGPARPAAEAVAKLDEAPLVSLVVGRHSVIAELRTRDAVALQDTVARVRALSGVRHVETTVYTDQIKDPHAPPGRVDPIELDEIDRQLIEVLVDDGRAPFTELAPAVGLSPSAVRDRVLRMLRSRVLHIGALVVPGAVGLGHSCGIGVRLNGPTGRAVAEIAAMAEVNYLASTLGRWDAVGTVMADSPETISVVLDRVRALSGVGHVECWSYLEIVKEDYTAPPLQPPVRPRAAPGHPSR